MKYTFYVYSTETGDYIAKRMTSQRFPKWSDGTFGRFVDGLPKDIQDNPEYFKLSKMELKELPKKDRDKIGKRKNTLSVKL